MIQDNTQSNISYGKETNVSDNNVGKQILIEVSWLKRLSAILLVAVILQTVIFIVDFLI